MDTSNKAKVKDGLSIAIIWFVWGIVEKWRELHMPGVAEATLINLVMHTVVVSVVFGLFFRPLYVRLARHIPRLNKNLGEPR